jgi:hypothetical protein
MYKTYVRDSRLNRVAEIEDYIKLDFIPRFNSPGSWLLEIPTNTKAAKELTKPKAGIIVKRGNQTVFSGPALNTKRNWNKDEDKMTVSGSDDLVHLYRNLLYPVPSGPPYTSNDYDVRTGATETVMKEYIKANIGVNARPERKVPLLTVEVDKGLGKTVTGRARFHNIVEKFRELALAGGDLGFRVVQVGKELQFQVFQPTDKSKNVFFSPLLGNLLDFEYGIENPEANYVIVGGGGEGTARKLLEKGNSASISKNGRVETFIDRRDTTDTFELQQSLDEELKSKSEKTSLSISPIDTERIAFGKDYILGDKVSVVLTQPNEVVDEEKLNYFLSTFQTTSVGSQRVREIQEKLEIITDVIREVRITISPEGERISPVIGTPDSLSHPIFGLFDKMKKMNKRLNHLERR